MIDLLRAGQAKHQKDPEASLYVDEILRWQESIRGACGSELADLCEATGGADQRTEKHGGTRPQRTEPFGGLEGGWHLDDRRPLETWLDLG